MPITRRNLLAGILATSLPGVEPQEIALGPTLLTFGELAEKLSLPERPIRCVGNLRERGAFVCLKKRPRTQIEKIVLHALDLTLIPGKDGILFLERLPEVIAQEREWQHRVADWWKVALQDRVREEKEGFQASPPLSITERQGLWKELEHATALEEAVLGNEDETARKEWESLQERLKTVSEILSRQRQQSEKLYELGILERFARRPLEVLVRQGRIRETYPAASLLTPGQFFDLTSGDSDIEATTKRYRESYIETKLQFRRTGRYLQLKIEGDLRHGGQFAGSYSSRIRSFHIPDISPYGPEGAKDFSLLTTTLFQPEGDTPPLLGTTAQSWFDAARKRTESVLTRAHFHIVFTVRGSPETNIHYLPNWFSQAVEAWCRQMDTEAVMELYPLGGEYLLQQTGDGVTVVPKPDQVNLRQIMAWCSDQWGVEEREGVYLFRNYLAFLDRSHSFPMTAFLKLYRQISPSDLLRQTPTYPPLARYCQTAFRPSETTVQVWVGVPPTDYRNVDIWNLEACRALLPLWQALSEAERQEAIAWYATRGQGETAFRVPLSRFAETTIMRMAEVLDLTYLFSLHTDYLKNLRDDHLLISCFRRLPHQSKHDITLRLEKTPYRASARFFLPIPGETD